MSDFGERYADVALGCGLEKPRKNSGRRGKRKGAASDKGNRGNSDLAPGTRTRDRTGNVGWQDLWNPHRTPRNLR